MPCWMLKKVCQVFLHELSFCIHSSNLSPFDVNVLKAAVMDFAVLILPVLETEQKLKITFFRKINDLYCFVSFNDDILVHFNHFITR